MRRLALALLVVCASPSAFAQSDAEKESRAHWEKGVTAYDLGKFDEAAQEFEKAYELKADPAYLFNLAQTYRQKGENQKAVFFYRRYLKRVPNAKNKATVEARITELEAIIKTQEETRAKPPDTLGTPGQEPDKQPETTPPPADPPPGGESGEVVTRVERAPAKVRLAAMAGPAFVGLGDGPDVPTQFSIFAQGAYLLRFGAVGVELGAGFGFTPMPFDTIDGDATGSVTMLSLDALVGLRYDVSRRVALRLELGGGLMRVSGLTDRNPFTDGFVPASGQNLGQFRVAAGVDVAVVGGLLVSVTPAFSYSPASTIFDDAIGQFTRFDLLVGLGYAL